MGMKLKRWMERRGMNQKELAAFLEISEQSLSDYFLGNRGMSIKRAKKISAKTGIGILALVCPDAIMEMKQ